MKRKVLLFSLITVLIGVGVVACGKTKRTSSEKTSESVEGETGSKYSDGEKEQVLKDLSVNVEALKDQVNSLEDVEDADVVFEK